MPRRLLRPKEAWARLGCGKTKFELEYRLRDPADPYVPGAPGVKRLKPLHLGPRNIAYLENEADDLIRGLAELREAAPPVGTRTTQHFLTDALPPRLERERRKLLERRNMLRAQVIADADPETKTEIESVEQALRALDQPQE
jgi:hypothetical protein